MYGLRRSAASPSASARKPRPCLLLRKYYVDELYDPPSSGPVVVLRVVRAAFDLGLIDGSSTASAAS